MFTTGLNGLLVSKCIDILVIFHAQNGKDLWVNEIVRKVMETTGSKDSPAIKKAIKLLETALLIQTVHVNKQKEIKILTKLGQEVSDFVSDLKKCSWSYNRLKDIIIENNIKIGKTEDHEEADKIVDRKLLAKGWNHLEIQHFNFVMRAAFVMEMIYRNNIFNSILYRYSVIRSNYEINDEADEIIQKIMMNEIQSLFMLTRELEQIGSKFNEHYFNPETSHYKDIPFVDFFDLIMERLEYYYYEGPNLTNKSISRTIEEVTLSLLLLLQPDEEYIHDGIKNLGVRKNEQEEKMLLKIQKDSKGFGSQLIDKLSLIKLRSIYQKYLDIKRRKNDFKE